MRFLLVFAILNCIHAATVPKPKSGSGEQLLDSNSDDTRPYPADTWIKDLFDPSCLCHFSFVDDMVGICWSVNEEAQEIDVSMFLEGADAQDSWLGVGFAQRERIPPYYENAENSCSDDLNWLSEWGNCSSYVVEELNHHYCGRDRGQTNYVAQKACPEACEMCSIDFCDLEVTGGSMTSDDFEGFYYFDGMDGDNYPVYKSDDTRHPLYIYYDRSFGWNIGDTLGSNTVRAFVQEPEIQIADISEDWQVWVEERFRRDPTIRINCKGVESGADVIISHADGTIQEFNLDGNDFASFGSLQADLEQDLLSTLRDDGDDRVWFQFDKKLDQYMNRDPGLNEERDVDLRRPDLEVIWAVGSVASGTLDPPTFYDGHAINLLHESCVRIRDYDIIYPGEQDIDG